MTILIILLVLVGIGVFFFIQSKPANKPRRRTSKNKTGLSPSTSRTSQTQPTSQAAVTSGGKVPQWLTEELEKFQRKALSYAYYDLSLDDKYSQRATEELEKLGETVYAPPPLLLNDAQNQNNCTCQQLEEYLIRLLKEKAGKDASPHRAQQLLEDYLASQAKEEALRKCSQIA